MSIAIMTAVTALLQNTDKIEAVINIGLKGFARFTESKNRLMQMVADGRTELTEEEWQSIFAESDRVDSELQAAIDAARAREFGPSTRTDPG